MKKRNKKQRRQFLIKKIKISIFILLIIILSIFIYLDFDQRLDDTTELLIETKTKNIITSIVNETINDMLFTQNISSTDLYTPTFNENGDLLTIEVNTFLINRICNALSTNIETAYSNNLTSDIEIPLQSLYGFTILDGIGPTLSNTVAPIGSVSVSYDTSFVSAGINQTKFDLWLTIESELQMTTPISSKIFTDTRTVPLISTIINGTVPEYVSGSYNSDFVE